MDYGGYTSVNLQYSRVFCLFFVFPQICVFNPVAELYKPFF